MSRILWTAGAATAALAMPTIAHAQAQGPAQPSSRRVTVQPYVEVSQALDADLDNGDVLTYTSLAAGIDAAITTDRIAGQVSYRYERRIGWGDDVGDSDIHSGLARADIGLTRDLSFDVGGIATRSRSDIRGAAPGNLVGDVANVAQVYSVYGGPTLATDLGVFNVGASYQLGYTKVETPTATGLGEDRRRLDYYDDSVGQTAAASIGTRAGTLLPVGITLSGAYSRETASQLSQRYEGWYGRGDLLAPVSATVALAGGVGYERIEASQKDPLYTAAGVAALDRNGRFVTDPASPRRIAYRTDGVYYDAGVVWRPNRRTEVRGTVGKRYGSTSYTGTATYQANATTGFAIGVYDQVTTFGRQLRTGLAALPTSFTAYRDPFGQQFGGCTFGTSGAAPGGCLDDVFQSISTASYRARGVEGVAVVNRGRSTYGAGLGYANRRLFAPGTGSGIVAYGQDDDSIYGQLFYSRTLSPVSGVDANLFANHYNSDVGGTGTAAGVATADDGVWSGGATGTYYRNFGRLSTSASVGLYAFKVGDLLTTWSAQALLGARYTF